MKRVGRLAAALACAAVCGPGAAQVALRGGETAEGAVTGVGIEGVRIRIGDAAAQTTGIIGWDRVRIGGGGTLTVSQAEEFGELADSLWRARTRIERGDWRGAEPLLEGLYDRYVGVRGPSGAVVHEATLRCRLARGAVAGSVWAWLEWMQDRAAAGVANQTWIGGKISAPPIFNEATGLIALLPPIWLGEPAINAAAISEEWRRYTAAAGAAGADVAELAGLYRAATRFEAGLEPEIPAAVSASNGVRLVRSVVEARAGDEAVRASAREALSRRIGEEGVERWVEAWCRAAIGRSLVREPDATARQLGVVELLHVPARFSRESPYLAGVALAEASVTLAELGDAVAAGVLRWDLETRFPRHQALAWSPLREIALVQPSEEALVSASDAGESDAAIGAGEELEAELRRLGLRKLLAEHLFAALGQAPRERRVGIAERLARVYVELLTASGSSDERRLWEHRSEELLRLVPEADGSELRLNLAKAIYLRAEEAVEKGRLLLATAAELEEAQRSLRALDPQFVEIASRSHRRVEQLERVEEQGDTSEGLQFELADARRVRSLAFYYAGWCKYYVALLTQSDPPAAEAMKCFGWLLGASQGKAPSLERMPAALLRYEHIARAAVGCGLCAALRGNDTEAVRWLDAVAESDEAPPAVQSQMLARRMIVLAAAKRWADLEQVVRRARNSDRSGGGPDVRPLSIGDARLLAVLTLGADKRIAADLIQTLAKAAMADLVAAGEIAHVLDLVGKFGTAPLGDAGFIGHFVRGVQQYDLARAAHTATGQNVEEPSSDSSVVNQYRAAADLLVAALRQSDAESYRIERARAGMLVGLGRFYAGDLLQAAESFVTAWELAGRGEDGEEALWLTIVSLDRALQPNAVTGRSTLEQRRNETTALYLQTYPDSPRAARLLLMQVSSGLLDDEEALRVLGGVARDSPVYDAARRQVARILYNKYRAARGSERDFAAQRFVGVAEEVLGADRKAATQGSGPETAAAAERVVVRVRQLLDALLSVSSPDAERAEANMQVLRGVAAYSNVDLADVQDEIAYRELQIAMARGRGAEAEALADRLNESSSGRGEYAAAADRLVYRRAWGEWKNAGGGESGADRVVKYGVRVIDAIGQKESLSDAGVLTLYSSVSAAAAALWRSSGDVAMRDLSIRLDKQVLVSNPREEETLRRLAETAEAADDPRAALSCWITIVASGESGTPGWFEATYHTIRLLADVDPARAREAFRQHRALYPAYGPAPWGEKIRLLEESLPSIEPEQPPLPAEPTKPDEGVGQ